MSLFENLARTALGALSGHQSGGGLAAIVGNLINQQPGGLAGLVEKFAGAGLGEQARSWVGTGANLPVNGDQVRQALGSDKVAAIAQQLGLPQGQISDLIAQVLPQVVDRLTPNGEVPAGNGLQTALGALMQSDWLKNLTGPR